MKTQFNKSMNSFGLSVMTWKPIRIGYEMFRAPIWLVNLIGLKNAAYVAAFFKWQYPNSVGL